MVTVLSFVVVGAIVILVASIAIGVVGGFVATVASLGIALKVAAFGQVNIGVVTISFPFVVA